ncbi:MAG: 16S rRNA (guanine(966)-N(2))-methyltransferase RsmD [Anaerolineae bacterium]|nr:16S rRNA (guanine(966)-N(2))-methyltransferase RsmD [Anaerolineae bacterium]
MPLRVIAGTAKGRRLKLVPGDSTRPVMDRVKEACFSIIGREVVDANFLDLFAGTGSIGIEALSRGARKALFIETNRLAVKTVQENLELTKLTDSAVIRRTNAFALLKSEPTEPFDIIYIAPPQYKDLWIEALKSLDANPDWMTDDALIIVQIAPSEQQEVELKHLHITDERQYGRTRLIFYRPNPQTSSEPRGE